MPQTGAGRQVFSRPGWFLQAALCSHALIALLLCTAASGQDATWSQLPAYPETIANNAVASVDNGDGTWTVYSFMGITVPSNRTTITAHSYRITLPGGDWEQIADAPLFMDLPKIGSSAVTVAGEVYLIGGYIIRFGREFTENRLFRYDSASDSYIELAEVPVEVDDTVAGVYQDRYIYLVSGWHGPMNNNVLNVQVYDTVTDAWIQATPLPGPSSGLFGHSGTVIGDRIIAVDGVKFAAGFVISDVVHVGRIDPNGVGDLTEISWIELPAHPGRPTYRAAPSHGATPDGLMLLTGGTDNPYNFTGTGYNGQPAFPLDQTLAFDPVGMTWMELSTGGAHLPTMDHRALARVGTNEWITVGGMHEQRIATTDVYKLTVHFPCDADFNEDRLVNTADLLGYLLAWVAQDPSADIDGDGSFDQADLTAFLELFDSGC